LTVKVIVIATVTIVISTTAMRAIVIRLESVGFVDSMAQFLSESGKSALPCTL